MTVQAQTKPIFGSRERTTVRGLKGWVVGFVALAAAGTGIGFAVAQNDGAPAVERIAPVTQNPAAGEEPEVEWYLPGKPGIK